MASWAAVYEGDRETLSKRDWPQDLKTVVAGLLAHYPSDNPITQRTYRRPKDSNRPIEVAQSSDGATHAVGNFEDVTVTHVGVYRVTLQGTPDDYGTIQILIEANFSAAKVSDALA